MSSVEPSARPQAASPPLPHWIPAVLILSVLLLDVQICRAQLLQPGPTLLTSLAGVFQPREQPDESLAFWYEKERLIGVPPRGTDSRSYSHEAAEVKVIVSPSRSPSTAPSP